MIDSLDNVIENAYEYGRTGIETYVDQFLKDADKEQRRKLKEQILVIWDRIIQYWMDKKTDKAHGPSVSPVAITDSIGEIVYNEGKLFNTFTDMHLQYVYAHKQCQIEQCMPYA